LIPNIRSALDARVAPCLHTGRRWPGASESKRYVKNHVFPRLSFRGPHSIADPIGVPPSTFLGDPSSHRAPDKNLARLML